MSRNLMIGVLVAVALMFDTTKVEAHGGATGIVKERMDLMDSISDAIKALSDIMKGKVEYDADKVRDLANSIERQGGNALTDLFPQNSLDRPTEALPLIWDDWERFSSLAHQLSSFASALGSAANNNRSHDGKAGMGMTGQGQGLMRGQGMMKGRGMMGTGQRPTAEMLAQMPPDAAFSHLANTCSACHQDYRKKN